MELTSTLPRFLLEIMGVGLSLLPRWVCRMFESALKYLKDPQMAGRRALDRKTFRYGGRPGRGNCSNLFLDTLPTALQTLTKKTTAYHTTNLATNASVFLLTTTYRLKYVTYHIQKRQQLTTTHKTEIQNIPRHTRLVTHIPKKTNPTLFKLGLKPANRRFFWGLLFHALCGLIQFFLL